jgi:hypothetical protein
MQLIRDNLQITWNARKFFGWFKMQEDIGKITIEKIFKAKLEDKAG